MILCAVCSSADIQLLEALADGRKRVECENCGRVWTHGTAAAPVQKETGVESSGATYLSLKNRFPKPEDVEPGTAARAHALKARFLAEEQPTPGPKVGPYWAKFQEIFSDEGLPEATPDELKLFANDPTGVYSGIMTEFNKAWNRMGAVEGSERVRQVVDHLLRGPGEVEDRLTDLIQGKFSFSMPGFKEALLTKTLCVVYPERFLTIVTYDQKRSMAHAVYGLDLPGADRVSWTIGRLIVWSNDLLRELVGDGFVDQQHAAQFLWWAKDRPH
jgi:hypothetical protein